MHPSPDPEISAAEASYMAAARSDSTNRGYESDWREFVEWCRHRGDPEPLPAKPEQISAYLTELVAGGAGAKVGTLSRRLSSIRHQHRMRDLPDPTGAARVVAVWEGIRRRHGEPPEQSSALMPPLLFEVLDACPSTKTWKAKNRPDEPDLAGARDRVLLLLGFVAALRRSELTGVRVEDLKQHPKGMVLTLGRSKTNQTGEREDVVVLPRASRPEYCVVTAIERWLELTGITEGPLLRPVLKSNKAADRTLGDAAVNALVQSSIERAGHSSEHYSAHSLRAGFVTYANIQGASDRDIARQTRHRSMETVGKYIRHEEAWRNNAATRLDL